MIEHVLTGCTVELGEVGTPASPGALGALGGPPTELRADARLTINRPTGPEGLPTGEVKVGLELQSRDGGFALENVRVRLGDETLTFPRLYVRRLLLKADALPVADDGNEVCFFKCTKDTPAPAHADGPGVQADDAFSRWAWKLNPPGREG